MTRRLAQIWRHPVKGVGAEPLTQVTLTKNRPMPLDRAWAVLTGDAQDTGTWQSCRNFARGGYAPGLMAVTARVNGADVTFEHPDLGQITLNPVGGGPQLVDWIMPLCPAERPAPRQVIRAPEDTGMADASFASLSVLNLSSLRALGQKLGRELDPRRFRGNLWLDGLPLFEELELVGKTLVIGEVRLEVVEPIERCRATEANPATGRRDANTLGALRDGWGHTCFGVNTRVIQGGTVEIGQEVTIA